MTMGKTVSFLAAIGFLFTGGVATADPHIGGNVPPIEVRAMLITSGTITAVDHSSNSFVLKTTDGLDITLKFNNDTTFTLDGEKSSQDAALKVDALATVSHSNNHATLVAVSTVRPEEEPGIF